MNELRFVVEHRPSQIVVCDGPFLDDPELLPSLGPLKRKLDAPNLFVQTPPLRPARVRRQEEDLDHFRLPHHLIFSNPLFDKLCGVLSISQPRHRHKSTVSKPICVKYCRPKSPSYGKRSREKTGANSS